MSNTKPDNMPVTHQEPKEAFEAAIQMGYLSADPSASNYAGLVMYMGDASDGVMLFKDIITRAYGRCE